MWSAEAVRRDKRYALVSAYNSPFDRLPNAFVCDGKTDEEQLKYAFDQMKAVGGQIILTPGDYYLTADQWLMSYTTTDSGGVGMKCALRITGAGRGATVIHNNLTGSQAAIEIKVIDDEFQDFILENFTVQGNASSGPGIYLNHDAGAGSIEQVHLTNILSTLNGGEGFKVRGQAALIYLINCHGYDNDGDGFKAISRPLRTPRNIIIIGGRYGTNGSVGSVNDGINCGDGGFFQLYGVWATNNTRFGIKANQYMGIYGPVTEANTTAGIYVRDEIVLDYAGGLGNDTTPVLLAAVGDGYTNEDGLANIAAQRYRIDHSVGSATPDTARMDIAKKLHLQGNPLHGITRLVGNGTGSSGCVLQDLKNSTNTTVSGTIRTVEIAIGGTPYYVLVYPTSSA